MKELIRRLLRPVVCLILRIHSRPYEGVINALQEFRRNGATLAVCTNKLEVHARALLEAR